MDIKQYKEILTDKSSELLKMRLKDVKDSIRFLESIYQTGGENSSYSKEFKSAAHTERQELCQLSSALHSILRERGEIA